MNVIKEMDIIYNTLVKLSVNSLTIKLYIQNRNQLQKTIDDNRLIPELEKIIDFSTKEMKLLELII